MTVAITAYPAQLAAKTSQRSPYTKAKSANAYHKQDGVTVVNGGNVSRVVTTATSLAATSGGSNEKNSDPVPNNETGTKTAKSGAFAAYPLTSNVKGVTSNNPHGNRISQVKHRFRADYDRKYHPEIVAVDSEGYDYTSQQLKELDNSNYDADLLGGVGITAATFGGTADIANGVATLAQNENLTFEPNGTTALETFRLIVYCNADVSITVDGIDDNTDPISFTTPFATEESINGRMILEFVGSGADSFTITNPNAADLIITNIEIRKVIGTNIAVSYSADTTTKINFTNGFIPVNVTR